MPKTLEDYIWFELKKAPSSPEDRVEQALQRALDSTTVERPGVPWDEKFEEKQERGIVIPGGD